MGIEKCQGVFQAKGKKSIFSIFRQQRDVKVGVSPGSSSKYAGMV